MNPSSVSTPSQLFAIAESEALYANLVNQVVKDFNLASVELDLDNPQEVLPSQLIHAIEDAVYLVIQRDNVSYMNLLYIVDVPEKAINALASDSTEQFSKDIAFLILKRCWMKVWYKAKY